jgi:hypothetical protein
LGEYDIDLLSDAEKQQVEDYLSNQKSWRIIDGVIHYQYR